MGGSQIQRVISSMRPLVGFAQRQVQNARVVQLHILERGVKRERVERLVVPDPGLVFQPIEQCEPISYRGRLQRFVAGVGDTIGAVATMLNLPEGGGTTTIESKTNFWGPAPSGAIVVAECTPIHRGKRTLVWQTRISTKEGRLVAILTQTQLVL
jgi:hypothetical protein